MRSFNILIVDDESFVVDWLCSILSTDNQMNFHIFTAYGVAQAQEILESTHIDILLSDIRMPDGNGLTLAACARKAWSTCKILMLTAYSEFDYAKMAIDNNVDGYILKTEKDEYILDKLRQAANDLSVMLDERQHNINIQQDLDHYMVMYQNSIFSQWLRDGLFMDEPWEKYAHILGFALNLPFYLILGRVLPAALKEQTEPDVLKVRLAGDSLLKESAANIYSSIYGNDVYFLLQPSSSSFIHYQDLLESQMEMVSNSCMERYGAEACFVISSVITQPHMMSKIYWAMHGMLNTISSNGGNCLYCMPAQSSEPGNTVKNFAHLVPAMLDALNQNDENVFFQLQSTIEQQFPANTRTDDSEFQTAYLSIALCLADYLPGLSQNELNETQAIYTPTIHATVQSAFRYLHGLAAAIFLDQRTIQQTKRQQLIDDINDYIVVNANSDLSLADISEHFNYNADYLSRLYAKSTGKTLKKAIIERRLELIAALMVDERLSLNDVLERSGFKSRTYFNFFIKHALGITPSQYRQNLLEGSSKTNNNGNKPS